MLRYRLGTRLIIQGSPDTPAVGRAITEMLAAYRRAAYSPRYLEELQSYLVGNGKRQTWLPLSTWCEARSIPTRTRLTKAVLEGYLDTVQAGTTPLVYSEACAIVQRFLRILLQKRT